MLRSRHLGVCNCRSRHVHQFLRIFQWMHQNWHRLTLQQVVTSFTKQQSTLSNRLPCQQAEIPNFLFATSIFGVETIFGRVFDGKWFIGGQIWNCEGKKKGICIHLDYDIPISCLRGANVPISQVDEATTMWIYIPIGGNPSSFHIFSVWCNESLLC